MEARAKGAKNAREKAMFMNFKGSFSRQGRQGAKGGGKGGIGK